MAVARVYLYFWVALRFDILVRLANVLDLPPAQRILLCHTPLCLCLFVLAVVRRIMYYHNIHSMLLWVWFTGLANPHILTHQGQVHAGKQLYMTYHTILFMSTDYVSTMVMQLCMPIQS